MHRPQPHFQMAHWRSDSAPLYPGRGAGGLGYPTFVAPYTEGTIRMESREKVSPPNRHVVGKFILAHNCLIISHWDNSPLNWIGNENKMGAKHICGDARTSISTHSSGKK